MDDILWVFFSLAMIGRNITQLTKFYCSAGISKKLNYLHCLRHDGLSANLKEKFGLYSPGVTQSFSPSI